MLWYGCFIFVSKLTTVHLRRKNNSNTVHVLRRQNPLHIDLGKSSFSCRPALLLTWAEATLSCSTVCHTVAVSMRPFTNQQSVPSDFREPQPQPTSLCQCWRCRLRAWERRRAGAQQHPHHPYAAGSQTYDPGCSCEPLWKSSKVGILADYVSC